MDKRICYVQIQTPSGDKEIHNISLHGKITRKMSETGSSADISIANLAREDVEYLTTYTSPYVDQSKKKRINIFAGYESTGVAQIFSGDIYSALPEGKPDTWLNIKAKTEFFNQQNIITMTQNNITVKNLAQNVSSELKTEFVWRSKLQKTIDNFNFAGAKAKLINRLNKIGGIRAFIDNNTLYVVDIDEEPPKEEIQNSSTKESGTIKLINKDSGMIGIPQPDEFGVKVKILLDPAVNLGDWFKLESEMLPIVNGFYQVYEMSYDFATREPQYYIELKGKNKQV